MATHELSLIGGNVRLPAESLGRWILLWGMAIGGRGRVPPELIREPWHAESNRSQKYFATPPMAVWAAAAIGQRDRATIAALVERLLPEDEWEELGAKDIRERARERLGEIPGVQVRDRGTEQCGIVTFSAAQLGAQATRDGLGERNINVSVSDPAHTRIDAAARALPDLVRASVHYYNTEAEVERFCDELTDLLGPAGPRSV
jgi:selenocysteine lyase/cysteine desulfurase